MKQNGTVKTQVFAHIRYSVVKPTGVPACASQIFMIKVDAFPGQWQNSVEGWVTNAMAVRALWRQKVAIARSLLSAAKQVA